MSSLHNKMRLKFYWQNIENLIDALVFTDENQNYTHEILWGPNQFSVEVNCYVWRGFEGEIMVVSKNI